MSSRHVDALIFHLPDVAISIMAAVIVIGLLLVGKASLIGWIILPLMAFLALIWFKEYKAGRMKPVQVKCKTGSDG